MVLSDPGLRTFGPRVEGWENVVSDPGLSTFVSMHNGGDPHAVA